MTVTIEADLRELFGPARDQLERPTCMAFAASDAHAAMRVGWEPLCVEWLYWHAIKEAKGTPSNGVRLSVALRVVKTTGQPLETAWPYLNSLPNELETWRPPRVPGDLFRRESDSAAAGLDRIKNMIDDGRPPIIVMTISDAFYDWDENGIVGQDEPVDEKRVHAVVAVGYGTADREEVLLIRNSWGDDWGIGGYGCLKATYVKPRLKKIAPFRRE